MHLTRQLIILLIAIVISLGACDDLLELDCSIKSDCSHVAGSDYNTTCLNGHCVCTNRNGESVNCKPTFNKLSNFIGGSCPCPQENAECNRQDLICYCKKDFIPSFDRRRCIKKSLALGEMCEDNSQYLSLVRFSECHLDLKRCICQKDFIEHSGICLSVVGLTDKCLDDNQCTNHTANSMCQSNTCTFANGFTGSKIGECLPFAGYEYNEPCKEDNHCQHWLGAGSECYMGLCACDYKHFVSEVDEINGQKRYVCERRIAYGDYCRDNNDCYEMQLDVHKQTMYCFFGECNCRTDFQFSDGECTQNASPSRNMAYHRSTLFISIILSFVILVCLNIICFLLT